MRKPKECKCKVCGGYFTKTISTAQKVCSPKCAIILSKEQARKKKEKEDKQERIETKKRMTALKQKIKSRSDWLNDLQSWVNKFVRLRDKNEPCISCGRYHQGQWHAGHYRSRGACPELRFNEDNIHKQCSVCNNHKSGNAIEYRINLISKIGLERVEFLERHDHQPLKLSIDEIKELIKVYKAKCKGLENDL